MIAAKDQLIAEQNYNRTYVELKFSNTEYN